MTICDVKFEGGVVRVVKWLLSALLVWCVLVTAGHAAIFSAQKITIGGLGFAYSVNTFSVNAPTQASLRLEKIDSARKIRWCLCVLNTKLLPINALWFDKKGSLVKYPINLSKNDVLAILLIGEKGAGLTVEVIDVNQPLIKEFTASPVDIEEGESATLSWQTTENAASVSITPAPASGNSDKRKGSLIVTPAVTTSYTITAANKHSAATDTVVVTVRPGPPKPLTARLTITRDAINQGENATLSWRVTGADKTVIDQGIGQVSLNGSMQVAPASSTTYTLTASNRGGSVTAEAVIPAAPPALEAPVAAAPIAIDIAWPHEGDHFCDSQIVVYGRVKSAALYKYADVNGSFAPVDDGLFLSDDIELKPGANIIKVEAGNYGNDRFYTEKEITIFRDECDDWVEFALPYADEYVGYEKIAPFDCTVRIIPHTTAPVNWESAVFQYSGSEAVTITRIKDDEFRFHIPVFGLYTLDFQVSDENGSVYHNQLFFKGGLDVDWSTLDDDLKPLEDAYLEFLKTMDAPTARKKVLDLAEQNPDICAGLNGKTLGFTYKGSLSVLLDLPDP